MDALPLNPDGYDGTYKLVGGRLCLDFVNTLAWPGTGREHDWFGQWTNVVDWSLATNLVSAATARSWRRRYAGEPKRTSRALEAIRQRRRIFRDVLAPLAAGESPAHRSIAALNELLPAAAAARQIDPETLDWTWRTPADLADVTAPGVFDAVDLVTEGDRTRLGRCPACDWLFYDVSRNRSRRWCDMADCGSRDKSLRYYHRQRRRDRVDA